MPATVYAIIVTYNRLETLKTAIDHVLAQTIQPEVIIIVDNNSTDGTREFLRMYPQEGKIKCLYLDMNSGCAGALSAGMAYGLTLNPCDYFWILDDDTFYAETALEDLIKNIEHSAFAMLGLKGAHIRFGKKIPVKAINELQEADYALIDGALIRTAAIRRIGVVDKNFFMMCEDHEYCLRLKKNGFIVGVLQNGADNRLLLGGQGSFTKSTLWRGYYSSRNHLLILKQYFSFVNLMGYIFLQSKLIVAAFFLAPDRFQRVRLRMIGIWHGIRGVGGKTLDPQTLKFSSH